MKYLRLYLQNISNLYLANYFGSLVVIIVLSSYLRAVGAGADLII